MTTPDSAGVTSDDETTGADGDQGDTDDVDDAVSDSAGGSASASGTTQLDISERHPNGTLLDISSITIEERTFNIEAEFFNGGSQDVTIAIDGGTAIVMTDEAGNTYPFVTPEDESDGNLTIAPGESISGTWTFLGQVRDASSLTLTVNMWGGGQRAEPVGRNQLPGVQDRVPAVVKQSLSRALAAGAAATLLSSCVSSTQPASPTDPAGTAPGPSPVASVRSTDEVTTGSVLTRSTVEARSVLTSSAVDVSSTLERRAVELFSELDARQEDASAVIALPDSVLFAFDEAELKPEADAVIADLVELAELTDVVPITIVGHTDGRGSDERNAALSEDRATAVAEALIAAGVAADRITAEGVGSIQPVAEEGGTDDEEARAQNRRVEVTFEGIDLDQ